MLVTVSQQAGLARALAAAPVLAALRQVECGAGIVCGTAVPAVGPAGIPPVGGQDARATMDETLGLIRQAVTEETDAAPAPIAFTGPADSPRTTSGKVQRSAAQKIATTAGDMRVLLAVGAVVPKALDCGCPLPLSNGAFFETADENVESHAPQSARRLAHSKTPRACRTLRRMRFSRSWATSCSPSCAIRWLAPSRISIPTRRSPATAWIPSPPRKPPCI